MLPNPRYAIFLPSFCPCALGRYQPNKAHVLRLVTVTVDVLGGEWRIWGKTLAENPKKLSRYNYKQLKCQEEASSASLGEHHCVLSRAQKSVIKGS
jgi:hypothetical protein